MRPHVPTMRLDLARLATPKRLPELPTHRWFYFPHSFDPALVETILTECNVADSSSVLDPFVGSGTTLLVAQQQGLSATGLDLSPVSVVVSRAKTSRYDSLALEVHLDAVLGASTPPSPPVPDASARLKRAFSVGELRNLVALRQAAEALRSPYREFFLVALLQTAREFSRAVPDGGWFRWVTKQARGQRVRSTFERCARAMIQDIKSTRQLNAQRPGTVEVFEGDARSLTQEHVFDAVVTSPPYPNRHDYTRVFHIELLLLGLTEPEVFDLRHQSLRSHVEAWEHVGCKNSYLQPPTLASVLHDWPTEADRRVPRMLAGYFEDLHTTMTQLSAVTRTGGCIALVVGNVRHAGRMIPVDEILAESAPQAGLDHTGTWVIRQRGNSAQQMGKLGRVPSRESVVFLSKP